MTEQEYINVRDLSSVINVLEILKHIVEENQPLIKKPLAQYTVSELYDLRDELFKEIKTD